VEWLASMGSLGDRLAHALKTRGKKPADLDHYLADRFGKEGGGSGYAHRVLKRGLQPGPDHLAAIADFLDVSLEWLIRGGPIGMGRKAHEAPPTYDSLTGWAEASTTEAARQRVPPYVIRAAGRSPILVPPSEVTADLVFRVAVFWLHDASDEVRSAALEVEARRIKAESDEQRKQ
jgi:hypothetical protein